MTILEVLQNAHYNLSRYDIPFQKDVGLAQLKRAILLLENEKSVYDDYDDVEADAAALKAHATAPNGAGNRK